jgi:two-component system sensor histidine kinase HydH
VETVTGQKESGGIEIPFITPKGTHKWLQVSSAPLYEKENEFVGGSVIFIDLTHVKKLQEEIKIKERLAALGEMSAQVAHEIRNPLGAIELNAEFLERKTEDEKSKVLTRNIIEEVKILNRIVTDFLAFAREPRLNKKKIALGPLLQKTADMACAAYKKIPIHIKISILPDFPLIELDENEFKKALLNFLLNAIEAMPKGGDLALTVESRDGACAILISDTGSGIPDAVKPRIFNPFFTTKETGTGLGLAIAHKIIAGHYGTLSFTSQADKGTTFLITLPFSSGENT